MESLSTQDLRNLIFQRSGEELPDNWNQEQILAWFNNYNRSFQDRGIPSGETLTDVKKGVSASTPINLNASFQQVRRPKVKLVIKRRTSTPQQLVQRVPEVQQTVPPIQPVLQAESVHQIQPVSQERKTPRKKIVLKIKRSKVSPVSQISTTQQPVTPTQQPVTPMPVTPMPVTPTISPVPEKQSNLNSPISTEENVQLSQKIRFPFQNTPIFVTPENVKQVRLPTFETKLQPIPQKPITPKPESVTPKLIQPHTPQQVAILNLGDIDISKISAGRASKGSNVYDVKELQQIAKMLGVKSGKTKAELANAILSKLRELGKYT